MQVSAQEETMATAHSGTVKIWDMKSKDIAYQLMDEEMIDSSSTTEDTSKSSSIGGFFGGSGRKSLGSFMGKGTPICSIQLTDDDLYMASLSRDARLKIWDLR